MRSIYINGEKIEITAETYRRVQKIADERKITFSDAVVFCLQKVI